MQTVSLSHTGQVFQSAFPFSAYIWKPHFSILGLALSKTIVQSVHFPLYNRMVMIMGVTIYLASSGIARCSQSWPCKLTSFLTFYCDEYRFCISYISDGIDSMNLKPKLHSKYCINTLISNINTAFLWSEAILI